MLFGQGEVWLHFDENRISHGDGRIPAHEVAANMPQGILHLGLYAGLSDPVGLDGPALQKVYPIFALRCKVAGVFDIHGIVVFLGQNRHEPLHDLRKIRAPQELLEVDDVRDTLAVQTHLPKACGGHGVRLHEQGGVGTHGILIELFDRQGEKAVFHQADDVDLVLTVTVLVAVVYKGRRRRRVQVHKTGVIVRLPIHRARPHPKDHAQHTVVVLAGLGTADIEVFGMPDASQMGVIILAVNIAADAHDQQGHLFIPVQKLPLRPVADGLGTDCAGIDRAYGVLEHLIALLQAALVGAEDALILPSEGISDPVLQERAGADNDRGLPEVFQHGEELLFDSGHERAMQKPLPEFRRDADIILRLNHFGPQIPCVVLNRVGVEHVGPNVIGIVGLDSLGVERRIRIPENVASQQHADRFAADTAGADLTPLDLHQIPHGEVFSAQIQPLRFGSEQTAEDILLQRDPVGVGWLRVIRPNRIEHAVPAVATLPGLREDIKDRVGLAAGGNRLAMGPVDSQGEIHGAAAPADYLDRMNICTAVECSDI